MTRLLELQKFADGVATASWHNYVNKFPKLLTFTLPTVVLSKRMKTTAGLMNMQERKMSLCYDLLDFYPEEYRLNTIPHELGHQVAYDLFGIGKETTGRTNWHGDEWKRVMLIAGYEFGRCHNMVNPRHKK
jgi:predicted SprT family Zn-dependent metalloprotease